MSGWSTALRAPLPEQFPRFAVGEEGASPRAAAWPVVAMLLALCLAPRVAMAWRMASPCDDSFYYVAVAEALENGDTATALQYLGLNVYPLILAGLHRIGFEWLAGGTAWSVVASSLVVLPLFGWVRRLFDDRVALAAGFLYAIHPKLIEYGVEPIRESTFWLLLSLGMYCCVRAADELRRRWFAASGATIGLAVLTRGEGWLLLIPAAAWTAAVWQRAPASRRRLIAGCGAQLAAIVLVVAGMNVAVIGSSASWRIGKPAIPGSGWLIHSGQFAKRGGSHSRNESATVGVSASGPLSDDEQFSLLIGRIAERPSLMRRIEQFALALPKAIGPGVCVLMLCGLVGWRRTFVEVERWPLLAMAGVALAGIAAKCLGQGVINGRYFLTVSLVAAPCDAIAFAALVRRLLILAPSDARWRPSGVFLARFLVAGSAVFGWSYALSTSHPGRASQVALGERLRSVVPAGERIVADARSIRIAYTACGRLPETIQSYADLERRLVPLRPAAVLLSETMMRPADKQAALDATKSLDLVRLDPSMLPRDLRGQIVLVRRSAAVRALGN